MQVAINVGQNCGFVVYARSHLETRKESTIIGKHPYLKASHLGIVWLLPVGCLATQSPVTNEDISLAHFS